MIFQGKSLSLICGALTWLRDHEEKKKDAAKLLDADADAVKEGKNSTDASEPDWVSEFVQKKAERDMVNKLKVRYMEQNAQIKSCACKMSVAQFRMKN